MMTCPPSCSRLIHQIVGRQFFLIFCRLCRVRKSCQSVAYELVFIMTIPAIFFRYRALAEPLIDDNLTESTEVVKTTNIGGGISFHNSACITLGGVIDHDLYMVSDHTARGLLLLAGIRLSKTRHPESTITNRSSEKCWFYSSRWSANLPAELIVIINTHRERDVTLILH